MAPAFPRKKWRRPQRLTLEGPPVVRRKDLVAPQVLSLDPARAHRRNRILTWTILTCFLVLAGGQTLLLAWLGVPRPLASIVFALAVAYLIAVLAFGDRWSVHILGASRVHAPEMIQLLKGLAQKTGVAIPSLHMAPGEKPNALSGKLGAGWIVITAGSARLSRHELEAMFSHEIVRLRDGEARVSSVFALLGGAPEFLGKALAAPAGFFALLAVPLWPACVALRAFLSGFVPARDLRTDVAAALITRYPPAMASMLDSAGGEQVSGRLGIVERFWLAPAAGSAMSSIKQRAEAIREM